jgi:hypothetical protein
VNDNDHGNADADDNDHDSNRQEYNREENKNRSVARSYDEDVNTDDWTMKSESTSKGEFSPGISPREVLHSALGRHQSLPAHALQLGENIGTGIFNGLFGAATASTSQQKLRPPAAKSRYASKQRRENL